MECEKLLTPCGVYGGSCARYIGYQEFRNAAKIVLEVADSHGFQYWMPHEVKEFDYAEFRKGIEFFSRDDAWLVCTECCSGTGGPPWCVRDCCTNHEVDVCFECVEFPCEKVKDNEDMLERGKEYQLLGREKWLLKRCEEAENGFEFHSKKFYQVRRESKQT